MPSIYDVARAAGVSIATVSHAMRGTRHVAAGTRARIAHVAAELGYQPNRLARGLRTQRTQTVGTLVAPLRNPTAASLVEGAEAVLGAAGYSVVLATQRAGTTAHDLEEQEVHWLTLLRGLRVDGLIVHVPSPPLPACCSAAYRTARLDPRRARRTRTRMAGWWSCRRR